MSAARQRAAAKLQDASRPQRVHRLWLQRLSGSMRTPSISSQGRSVVLKLLQLCQNGREEERPDNKHHGGTKHTGERFHVD